MRAAGYAFLIALSVVPALGATSRAQTYFDAHNHFTGILPYQAYANLPAFIKNFSDPHAGPTLSDRLALYRYLRDVWYATEGTALGDRLFSPPEGQRFAFGARAALVVYRRPIAIKPADVDGVLERVLTATPWSEFDSAYAFRGGPASEYLLRRFYGGDWGRLSADVCTATVLDLARTNIDISEQSLPFIGGWHFQNGRSEKLDSIECPSNAQRDATVIGALHRMRKAMPTIAFVLMTHTAQLATSDGGKSYTEWSKTGRCASVALPAALETTPSTIYHALLAQDDSGAAVVPQSKRSLFFATVVGIDTAGPETTCFTPEGMQYYGQLIDAVYRAAKQRRQDGWHGKLLVHTHVGEGAVVDYAPSPPPRPWTFASTFSALPHSLSNSDAARANISMLLGAVATFERIHPDVHDYVLFRFAHDTWADPMQAQAMHDEQVEADVNLESNVATGAYPLRRMPLGLPLIMRYWVDPTIANEDRNLRFNDELTALVSDPANVRQVGGVLGDASLKYLLEHRVRCILGTDADGVEHSDIVKEYAYAASLIEYWNRTDPQFRSLASGVSEQTLFENARWHLHDMTVDAPLPY
ncbi:MAG TPA: hypothetical protein VNG31_06460 [Candidatus Baltobacteraceae bacterium]|nr:hypothetical protein [Candidatus Baltobacteraceae bacterium]